MTISRFVGFLLVSVSVAPRAVAQADSLQREFEVVSVKRSRADDQAISGRGRRVSAGILDWQNITLELVIESAYSVNRFQIKNAPSWLETDRFDISARAPEGKHSDQEFSLMIQKLLADRFGLVAERDTSEFPTLKLVRTGSKAKLVQSTGSSLGCGLATAGRIDCERDGATMEMLARQLQAVSGLQMPIVDATGLTGIFRFNLVWMPDDLKAEADPRPSLDSALREQLGLTLKRTTSRMPVIAIKSLRRNPSEN